MRGDERGRSLLLGLQRHGPAWRRDNHEPVDDHPGERPRQWCGGSRGRLVSHVRGDQRRGGVLLGLERLRPPWRRDDDGSSHSNRGEWLHGGRGRNRDGASAHLRAHHRRCGLLLGQQRLGSARRRDDDQRSDPDSGQWRRERRRAHRRRPESLLRRDERRGDSLLGQEPRGPSRRRNHDHAAHRDRRERPRDRDRGRLVDGRSHLRGDIRWRRGVLGLELARSTRRRKADGAVDARADGLLPAVAIGPEPGWPLGRGVASRDGRRPVGVADERRCAGEPDLRRDGAGHRLAGEGPRATRRGMAGRTCCGGTRPVATCSCGR